MEEFYIEAKNIIQLELLSMILCCNKILYRVESYETAGNMSFVLIYHGEDDNCSELNRKISAYSRELQNLDVQVNGKIQPIIRKYEDDGTERDLSLKDLWEDIKTHVIEDYGISKDEASVWVDKMYFYRQTGRDVYIAFANGAIKLSTSYCEKKYKPYFEKTILDYYDYECTFHFMEAEKIGISNIKDSVCNYFHVNKEALSTTERNDQLVLARQVCMLLMRDILSLSIIDIGKEVGKKDHTSVVYGIKKAEEKYASEQKFRDDVEAIKKQLWI